MIFLEKRGGNEESREIMDVPHLAPVLDVGCSMLNVNVGCRSAAVLYRHAHGSGHPVIADSQEPFLDPRLHGDDV